MEYEVQLVPVNKAILTHKGVLEPLCNNCLSPDCSNPIKNMVVSIVGIPTTYKLWVEKNGMVRQVSSCKGYICDEE